MRSSVGTGTRQSLPRGSGSSNSFLDDAARLLVGPREQRAHLARCRAERSQSRSRQLTLDELAHAQRLDGQKQRCPLPSTIHSWAANGLCSGAQRTALGRGAAAQRTTTCDHAAARARKESDDQVPTGAGPEGSRCPARASRLRDGARCGVPRRRAALIKSRGRYSRNILHKRSRSCPVPASRCTLRFYTS